MLYAAWEDVTGAFVDTADGSEALAILFGDVGEVVGSELGKAVVVVDGDTRESNGGLIGKVGEGVGIVREGVSGRGEFGNLFAAGALQSPAHAARISSRGRRREEGWVFRWGRVML